MPLMPCLTAASGERLGGMLKTNLKLKSASARRRLSVALWPWATRVASATGKIRRTFITMLLGSAAAGRFLRVPVRVTARPRLYGQVNKRIRWMPWQLKAMKDVEACDKPRGVGKQTLIRGFPNGETQPFRWLSRTEYIGARSEPGELKYLSTRRKRNQPRFPE